MTIARAKRKDYRHFWLFICVYRVNMKKAIKSMMIIVAIINTVLSFQGGEAYTPTISLLVARTPAKERGACTIP